MFSVADIVTEDPAELSFELLDYVQEGFIIIEIPKEGAIYSTEPSVVHGDYVHAIYVHYLLSRFKIRNITLPSFDTYESFTFEIMVDKHEDFFSDLAKILIPISAAYGHVFEDEDTELYFNDDALECLDDWKSGKIKNIDPVIFNEYKRLVEEWPLDDDEDE